MQVPTDGYMHSRNLMATARLDLQHQVWRTTLGYAIHPSINTHDPNIKIADVGTGTGAWISELASSFSPTASLHGFDVSDEQFITADLLPDNVKLRTLDASQPVPDEIKGQYDVVHVRLIQVAVRSNDPLPFVEHCKSLLKPGGILQWEEFNSLAQIVRPGKEVSTSGLSKLAKATVSTIPVEWVPELPRISEQSGFQVVALEHKRAQTWQLRMLTTTFILLWMEVVNRLTAEGKMQQDGEMAQDLRDAILEAKDGAYWNTLFQVVVMKRPLV